LIVLRLRRSLIVRALRALLILRRRSTLLILRRRSTLLILRWRSTLLILRRRTLLVLLRTLLILRILLRTLLIALIRCALLVLIRRALLIVTLHLTLLMILSAMRVHHLAELVLLIGCQRPHELLAQLTHRAVSALASLGMRLRILMNHRLNALLLIAGEIELTHFARPMLLESPFTGHRLIVRSRGRSIGLLSVCADRHREGCGHNARGQEVDLHALDISPLATTPRERGIRT